MTPILNIKVQNEFFFTILRRGFNKLPQQEWALPTKETHLEPSFPPTYVEYLTSDLFLLQKAEAALAYELQAAKIKQKIRNEEIQIEVVERRKQIEVRL